MCVLKRALQTRVEFSKIDVLALSEIFRFQNFQFSVIFGKFSEKRPFSEISTDFQKWAVSLRPEKPETAFSRISGISGDVEDIFRIFSKNTISTNFTLILMMCTLLRRRFYKTQKFSEKFQTFFKISEIRKKSFPNRKFSPTFSKFPVFRKFRDFQEISRIFGILRHFMGCHILLLIGKSLSRK
jgi:hypothetical protein